MADDRPFTKDDAAAMETRIEKLFDARLATMNERITGMRNWVIALLGAAAVIASSTLYTHQPPQNNAKAAASAIAGLL